MVLLSCTCTITCSGYVHTVPDSFGAGTKIIPDRQGFCSHIRTVISRDILFYAFQVELEFRSVCFLIEEKNGVPGEKPLVARKITRAATNSTHICCRHWDSNPGHTLVGGECCHHCATPPLLQLLLCASLKGKAFMWFYFRFLLDVRI